MTQQECILKIAQAEIGTTETSSNMTKYNIWYYGKAQVAQWCCIFVSWVFAQAGLLHLLGGKHQACRYYEKGACTRAEEVPISQALPGDIVTFDFDNTGVAHHIGIVEKNLGGGKLQTIEGNTSDRVDRKIRSTGIRKVFRPKYESIELSNFGFVTIRKQNRGNDVLVLQYMLNFLDFNLELDGIFGSNTERAVREFQTKMKIDVDGIVGKQTWTCLLSSCFHNL